MSLTKCREMLGASWRVQQKTRCNTEVTPWTLELWEGGAGVATRGDDAAKQMVFTQPASKVKARAKAKATKAKGKHIGKRQTQRQKAKGKGQRQRVRAKG